MERPVSAPYFPKYAKDWLTGEGTRLMTPEQRGAFDWLLCHAWLSTPPCTLPDDDEALAKLSELGRRWKTAGEAVRSQFKQFPAMPGRIYNPKQFEIWKEMEEHRLRRSRAGKKGNAMRWDSESLFDRNAIANGSPSLPLAFASPETGNSQSESLPEEERPAAFAFCWNEYPRKRGLSDARRHFDSQIKTREDLAALQSAIENYRRELTILERDDQHTLHGSTFFNGRWREYVAGVWIEPTVKRAAPVAPVSATRRTASERDEIFGRKAQ
jgi:uncharacterized protein YdaU (DUF1376 family)